MRILLTGGSGSVGGELVKRLTGAGHEIRVLGRRPGASLEGAEYVRCDVTDAAGLRDAMRGCEAVLHLAALPSPFHGPGEEVFRINCDGSFKVYQVAAELGIRRVVSASSINAVGYNFGIKRFPIRYLPIDEEHPGFTTDSYSFSKQVLEEIAAYFWRREGISGCTLRLPWVVNPTVDMLSRLRSDQERAEPLIREWIALPPREGEARAEEVIAWKERARAERREQYGAEARPPEKRPFASVSGAYTNFFTVIDARDSAQAFEKALFAEYEGSHPLFVNDSVNRYGVSSRELARLFFPEAAVRPTLEGSASLVSIDRARRLIGFEPEYSVPRMLER